MIQRLIALAGLIVISPLLVLLGIAVRSSSPGPALHRSQRLSRGRPFTIYKFRTMRDGAAAEGPGVTAAADARITPIGRVLRRSKLDELPQLWNVVCGEMGFVGPRPEDPRYVNWGDPIHRVVFGARPGVTGPTVLAFTDEETLLASEAAAVAAEDGRTDVAARDVEQAYREKILPRKLAMDVEYLRTRTMRRDLVVIARTIVQVLQRTAAH